MRGRATRIFETCRIRRNLELSDEGLKPHHEKMGKAIPKPVDVRPMLGHGEPRWMSCKNSYHGRAGGPQFFHLKDIRCIAESREKVSNIPKH